MQPAPELHRPATGIRRQLRGGWRGGFRAFAPGLLGLLAALASAGATATAAEPTAVVSDADSSFALTRAQLLGEIANDLCAHFNLGGDLQLELLRPPVLPANPTTGWTIRIVEYPAGVSSSMLLRCRFGADAQSVAEATLLLRASLWRDAWVSRQPIAPGALFEPSEMEVRRVDFLRERDLVPAGELAGVHVFARHVSAGRLLTWRDLTRRPLVRKGEFVEVAASEGMLLITLRAVAMQNGAEGDTILLRNPASQKNFTALVVDENRVQVTF